MSETAERLSRAEQADTVMRQWVGPALALMKADYLKKLADVAAAPLNDKARAAIEKLALGIKVVDHIDREIASVIHDGAAARQDKQRADRLANVPAEARKWLNY